MQAPLAVSGRAGRQHTPFGLVATRAPRSAGWRTGGSRAGSTRLEYLAVFLSGYASLLHNWVLPAHFREWWGYGLFFLITAAAQGFYSGALLFWPGRGVFLAGIAGNAAILGLYVVTRTLGIPILGPHAGEVEPVGAADLVTATAEIALVIALAKLVRGLPRGKPPGRLVEETKGCY